jgi:hypothetical protein
MRRLALSLALVLAGAFASSETLRLTCTGKLNGTDSFIQFFIDDSKFDEYFSVLGKSHPEYDLSPYRMIFLAYSGDRGLGMLVTGGSLAKLLDGSESQLWVTATSADDAEFLTSMSFRVSKIDNDTYKLETYWNDIDDSGKEVKMTPMGTLTGMVERNRQN